MVMKNGKSDLENNKKENLSPKRIKTIREGLGLSQVEAGELIGGGPRAFTKYESGAIKPAAAVINLLKILETNPASLKILTGKTRESTTKGGRSPFEVSGKHVAELSADKFPLLMRRLLAAEAYAHSIPGDGIHVAENITAPDGGEDGRIVWTGGPEKTRYLRHRLNQFQLKSGKVDNKKVGKEILKPDGKIKPMVLSMLEAGGSYTLLCAHSYTKEEIIKKEKSIRASLKEAGLKIDDWQVAFWDSSQIAEWVNTHTSVAVWLLEQTEHGAIGKFKTWSYWKTSPEHSTPWVEDPRRIDLRQKLLPIIDHPKGVARVLGPPGVGKSRLVLETLDTKESSSDSSFQLSERALYIDEQMAGSIAVKLAVQNLADSPTEVIIVVDHCDAQTHLDLSNVVQRQESLLSLVTIDNEPPFLEGEGRVIVGLADQAVIEGILKAINSGQPDEDFRRLVRFSQGFPKIAVLLGQVGVQNIPVAYAPEDIAKAIIIGRDQVEADILFRGAQILSIFGIIYDSEIGTVSKLGRNLSPEAMRSAIRRLVDRGIVQTKGKSFMIQPRPVALNLAEKLWGEWGKDDWDNIIEGSLPEGLKKRAASQLKLLNTTDLGSTIGRHLLRRGGPFDSLESLAKPGHSEFFSNLAEIDTEAAVTLLERIIGNLSCEKLISIDNDTRRHIVWALDKVCFDPDTFERGAKLMLDLAVAENENYSNNATGQFKSLFPVYLGDTAADGERRLRFIGDALNTEEEGRLLIIVEALLQGAQMDHFSRSVGSETHGSRPALEPWQPETWGEVWNYIEECCNRLITLAQRKDEVGRLAGKGLGHKFRSLATRNLMHIVEKAIKDVSSIHGTYWPEAYESLGHVLVYDKEGLEKEIIQKVQELISRLQPEALIDRVRSLVTEMPWDYPCDKKLSYEEQNKRQKEDVEVLAGELSKNIEDLRTCLPQVIKGQQRMAAVFGYAISEKIDDPVSFLDSIIAALTSINKEERNFEFLSGYLSSLVKTNPDVVEDFKQKASVSSDLAVALPSICWQIDIKPSDIPLVLKALISRLINPWHLMVWSGGGKLAELPAPHVAPLFEILFEMGKDAYLVGINLMGMYAFSRKHVLEDLTPQIFLAAEKASTKAENGGRSHMDGHHFEEIMKWVLDKGRGNSTARKIALSLTRQLIHSVDSGGEELIKPLIPQLLADFPEISWPLIGQAIISNKKFIWKFEYLLGDKHSFSKQPNPAILNLPEDTLFAWCHANPEKAPAFVSVVAPVLSSRDPDAPDRTIHPVTRRLLDEFGDRENVLNGINRNIYSYGWSGSRTKYFELYELPFKELENHPVKRVRIWAQQILHQLGLEKAAARDEDEEQEAWWSI